MGNVGRVLARDIKRLLTTPAAWAVILFLTVLPSLYTWFNVAGFWDPYNNTGNLRVCIVNEDEGADVDGVGHLDLGSQIVDQLHGNDQLGWAFVDRSQAEQEVSSGAAYAAFIMPSNFSADVASILTGEFQQPQIEYYVNEKVGPVAPKITDTGANALDATINEAFVSTVSETVVTVLEQKLEDIDQKGVDAKSSALAKVDAAKSGVAETREKLTAAADQTKAAQLDLAGARSSLAQAKGQLDELSDTLSLISLLAGNADSSLIRFSTSAGTTLDAASRQLSQSVARTNASVAEDANAILTATGNVNAAIALGKGVTSSNERALAELENLSKDIAQQDAKKRVDEAIAKLKSANATAQRSLDGLQTLSDDTAQTATSVRAASAAVNDTAQQTTMSFDEFREALSTSIIPAIGETLTSISKIAVDLRSQSASQKAIVDQAIVALDELSDTLTTTGSALSSTADKLGALASELDILASDLAALGTASSLASLLGTGDIDPADIADFMMSPTKLETEELYPLNAYGSAMAPLFINLTLWIGVFMLMVIMRLEVDDEKIEHLTITQRFYGRFLLLAPLVCIQAAICCTGCLWIGVQSVNVPAFYMTAIIASLSYLAIQYTLSTTLQHIGKAICIILVFVQIPGASGIYPIEMTPDFFRTVYPMFPFTYGINAMRETICGFYDGQWASCMGVLVAFMAAFLTIGTVVRPYLTNLNRMFAREIAESDLIIGENVELPARRWRMSQVIRALSDREEYRTALEQRAQRFMRLYPQVKAGSLVVGILVPVLIALVLGVFGADKVIVLTTWLVWLIAIVTFLLVVDFLRDNLSHQLSLETMGVDEMRKLIGSRNRLTRVKPLEKDVVEGEADGKAETSVPEEPAEPAEPDEPDTLSETEGAAEPSETEGPGEADNLGGAADEGGAR